MSICFHSIRENIQEAVIRIHKCVPIEKHARIVQWKEVKNGKKTWVFCL